MQLILDVDIDFRTFFDGAGQVPLQPELHDAPSPLRPDAAPLGGRHEPREIGRVLHVPLWHCAEPKAKGRCWRLRTLIGESAKWIWYRLTRKAFYIFCLE